MGKNMVTFIYVWVIAIFRYYFKILIYSYAVLNELHILTQRVSVKFHYNQPQNGAEHLQLSRNKGGSGLSSIHEFRRHQENSMRDYFF